MVAKARWVLYSKTELEATEKFKPEFLIHSDCLQNHFESSVQAINWFVGVVFFSTSLKTIAGKS